MSRRPTVDVAQRVTTATVREARAIAQPPGVDAGLDERIYRGISIYLSMALARTALTPNQITIGWIVLGLVGSIALGTGVYAVRILGAVVLHISYLFDFVDGEVARLTRRTSKLGLYWDLVGHGLIKTALFPAIAYGLGGGETAHVFWLLATMACVSMATANNLEFYAARAGLAAGPPAPPSTTAPVRGPLARLRNYAGLAFHSSGLYLASFLGALLDRLDLVLWFYAILGPLWFLHWVTKYRYE
jgi:phosphatidylglycerophosphate synthase